MKRPGDSVMTPRSRRYTSTRVSAATKEMARPFHMSPLVPPESSISDTISSMSIPDEVLPMMFMLLVTLSRCFSMKSRAPFMKLMTSRSSSRPATRARRNTSFSVFGSPLPST